MLCIKIEATEITWEILVAILFQICFLLEKSVKKEA
jgi:hypothetical protein